MTELSPIARAMAGLPFSTKDSGKRDEYASGMVRDTQEGKPRFDLMFPLDVPYDQQMLTRIAALMARGAEKYGDRNWERGEGEVELDRAKSSAFRHFVQWLTEENDEDHAAAVFFNIQQVEYLRYKMEVQNASSKEDSSEASGEGDHDTRTLDGKQAGRKHPRGAYVEDIHVSGEGQSSTERAYYPTGFN